MIEKKYTVIYADPPWKYKVWSGGGAADAHYPTMNLEDIKALPVSQLAAKDCALFLWITFPMLHEAWGVMKAWGFTDDNFRVPEEEELQELLTLFKAKGAGKNIKVKKM